MNADKLFEPSFSYHIHPKDHEGLRQYFTKKQGWVYVATSQSTSGQGIQALGGNEREAMQNLSDIGLLKIGRTGKNPFERAKTLSGSGVAYDYDIIYSLRFFNQFLGEKGVHERLRKVRGPKEFFRVTPHDARLAVEAEYQHQKNMLERFFDTQMLEDDIYLLEYALKRK